MYRFFGALGALAMAVGILAGAFGAHGLQRLTTDPAVMEPYKTAVQYLLWHGLALLLLWTARERFSDKHFLWTGSCFQCGIVLFCGSLFLITAGKIFNFSLPWIVYLTPVGGLFFVAGWVLLFWVLIRKQRN
ncbi:MAG: DUF423 domain-containing protein [Sphingomonadales bacterium]|nr:DUF423 domain-containing protein [Sphingomonadales bacterium]